MDNDPANLIPRFRAQLERAEAWRAGAYGAQFCAAVVALFSALATAPASQYCLAVGATILVVVKYALSTTGSSARQAAERARRGAMLYEGLGWDMPPKLYSDLLSSLPDARDGSSNAAYFSATADRGNARLAQAVQESTFWSCDLTRRTGLLFSAVAGLWLLLFTAPLVVLPLLDDQMLSLSVGTLAYVGLGAGLLWDAIDAAACSFEASVALRALDERLETVFATGCKQEDLVFAWSDYNAAVEKAPIIPSWLYRRHRNRLEKLWELRMHE